MSIGYTDKREGGAVFDLTDNPGETLRKVSIMLAWVGGEAVEWAPCHLPEEWTECGLHQPVWNWCDNYYRIKTT